MKKNVIKIIVIFLCVLLGIFTSILIYFYYPNPSFFWNRWHTSQFHQVDTLADTFEAENIYIRRMQCWDIFGRCGIYLVFDTPLSFSELKQKISTLGYDEKLSGKIDGHNLYTIFDIDAGLDLFINGQSYDPLDSSIVEPEAYEWWVIDPNNTNYDIDLYNTPSANHEIRLSNNNVLDHRVVSIVLYTRGN